MFLIAFETPPILAMFYRHAHKPSGLKNNLNLRYLEAPHPLGSFMEQGPQAKQGPSSERREEFNREMQ